MTPGLEYPKYPSPMTRPKSWIPTRPNPLACQHYGTSSRDTMDSVDVSSSPLTHPSLNHSYDRSWTILTRDLESAIVKQQELTAQLTDQLNRMAALLKDNQPVRCRCNRRRWTWISNENTTSTSIEVARECDERRLTRLCDTAESLILHATRALEQ
jgi:hypothetical protein